MTPARRAAALAAALAFAASLSAQTPTLKERLDEGFRLLAAKQPEAADAIFAEVLPLARAASDLRAEAEARRGRGRVLIERKDYAGAKAELDEALRLFEQAGDRLGAGHVLTSRGFVAWSEGDWPRLRESYEASVKAFAEAQAPREQANALRNLTFAPQLSWEERAGLIEQAFELLRREPDPELQGMVLHQWGDALFNIAQFAAALEKLEAALPLLEASKNPALLPRLLTSLGRIDRLHGDFASALGRYRRALALQEQNGDWLGASQSENAIAVLLAHDEQYRAARPHVLRALELAERAASGPAIAVQRLNLGSHYVEVRDLPRALPLLAADARLSSSSDSIRLQYLSDAYRLLGRTAEALRAADEAVAAARQLEVPELLLAKLACRARAHAALGDNPAAYADHLEALSLLDRMRSQLLPADRLRQGFDESNRLFFSNAVALLQEMGRSEEALHVAERGRARAFLDLLVARDRGQRGPRDAELLSLANAEPLGSAETAALLGRLRSTLVSYWVTDDATFVWVMTPDGALRSRRVAVSSRRLTALVRELESRPLGQVRGAVSDQAGELPEDATPVRELPLRSRGGEAIVVSRDPQPAARELFELLVRPVRDALPKSGGRLTVIPHGPLFALSFASLRDARGRYLLEDFALHYAPSAAVLARGSGRARAPGPARALLVADPTLAPRLLEREKLGPLPGARAEASAIARTLGASPPPTVLEGAGAKESEVRRRAPENAILHFATHGVVSDARPFDSFLALAAGDGDDGRLTAGEIYDLDLRADLVVLSACRSGRGRITGDGVTGLSRAFAYAGAPSLLATLSDLSDVTAARLLPDFYAAWRRTGDRAGALREAQLALLRGLRAGEISVPTPAGRFKLPEHPALWAPFVLLGEP